MRVRIVTPAPEGSTAGNRVTAERWAGHIAALGHSVTIDTGVGAEADVLVALHARRSHAAIRAWAESRGGAPLVVVLTGTDLYGDILADEDARRSLELATRLIVLQPEGLVALPESVRAKTRIVVQSAEAPPRVDAPDESAFEVTVVGHLRAVKDPFRTAEAARLLPRTSRIRVLHLGAALDADLAVRARREEHENPRYRWLGSRTRDDTLRILARSRLMVSSSRVEGGSNAVVEALACSVPVLASRIPGTLGQLGAAHPGYFEVGDTAGLALLLERAESEPVFLEDLRASGARARERFSPERELEAWRALLAELAGA